MSRDNFSYGAYLELSKILDAQNRLTDQHDEMLFIIQHQTSELWMKLALHELASAIESVQRDELQKALKMLARIARIFEQLNAAWDVLRTLTPTEYTAFRDAFGAASGFQSWQDREIEFLVGNKHAGKIAVFDDPHIQTRLSAALNKPGLYDAVLSLLLRRGFTINPAHIDRDLTQAYAADESVLEAWRDIYSDPETHWDLYDLAEKLVDFEDYFRRWRFNHVTTVERVIGFKRGSGGTGGVSYLKSMLETELFPELWHLRTSL